MSSGIQTPGDFSEPHGLPIPSIKISSNFVNTDFMFTISIKMLLKLHTEYLDRSSCQMNQGKNTEYAGYYHALTFLNLFSN